MKLPTTLFTWILAFGIMSGADLRPQPNPQWHTLTTEAYPKKRDDVAFADARTGFYGTGKGMLYRTQDGGQTWQLIWSKPGTFVRSLGFIDDKHGFLGSGQDRRCRYTRRLFDRYSEISFDPRG